jgi:hypothetical protein
MLKAVRFDEDKHKDLLKFVLDYKDIKGKQNESEAIRFLMQTGLNAINNLPINIPQPQTKSTSDINIESLKKELMNDIMSQINVQAFNTVLNRLDNAQNNIPARAFTEMNTSRDIEPIRNISTEEFKPTTQPIKIPAGTNPLLANILANAKR